MQKKRFAEYELSRLMLGTAQFGMPYGVANRRGQPSYKDVLAILSTAMEGGVNCFDTAAAYGNSEEILGAALHELDVSDRVIVVTKVRALTPEETADPVLAGRAIEESVNTSLRRLRLDSLPAVLFHREADARYLDVLESLKAGGLLRYFGVSCDNRPGPASKFVSAHNVSALQIPANILDRRHQQSGIFQEAIKRDVALFIRSVYLQGLLAMPEETIPPFLREVVPIRRALEALAAEAGMGLSELALRYMLAHDAITCVLAGVETVGQIRENIAIFDRGPLPADMVSAIDAATPDLPETILSPPLWPKKQAQAENGQRKE